MHPTGFPPQRGSAVTGANVNKKFMDYADEFLELVLRERSQCSRQEIEAVTTRMPFAIQPILISDYRCLSGDEASAIIHGYRSQGVAHFVVCNPSDHSGRHPLFTICDQVCDQLGLRFPLRHPLEGHPEAVKRFGPSDGTVKIYNLPKPIGGETYREVAETSDAFEVHLDGLGSGGTVQSVVLYMDSAPLFGGFTFFYDMLALGVALADQDMEAFRHLFLPDAFTALRPRGKGAIKVVSPVYYIDEDCKPHAFFRKNSGEYRMYWRTDCPPLERARRFLDAFTQPFSPGSFFVPFTRPGCACISSNRDMAHGRTGFLEGHEKNQRRVLSRKWFMSSAKHSIYKHVPGTAVRSDSAALAPDQFGDAKLIGEWLYSPDDDETRRLS
jgi:hypothetical protein